MDLGPPPYEPQPLPKKHRKKLPIFPLVVSLVITLLAASCGILLYQNYQLTQQLNTLKQTPSSPTTTPQPTPIPSPAALCGGIAGKACPAGQRCQMSGNYPDASGTCVQDASYVCPASGYVDCMPSPNAGIRFECTPEAMSWYKTNCPTFKGGAL